jgi:hypothetical protein
MLYRCDCKTFHIENNNYRKFSVALAISYSKYFLCSSVDVSKIVIVLFEPGGLLDEAIIIEQILSYVITMEYILTIEVHIVEPEPYQEYNSALKDAQDYFYRKFINYREVSIHYYTDIGMLKKNLQVRNIDYLLFLTFDPYEYIYLQYYKNGKEDIKAIINKVYYFLDISLFSLSGFFYDIELTFSIFNKKNFDNRLTQYRLFGNNNLIKYVIKSINYFQ